MAMVLRLKPDLEIIGIAENGRGGLKVAKKLNPEIEPGSVWNQTYEKCVPVSPRRGRNDGDF